MRVGRWPTEDNAVIYKGDEAAANDAWLDTFTKMLEMVKRTKGFVLQIQQGMQEAEERMGGWLDVPRIGVFAFPFTHVRGGTSLAELRMQEAIAAAQAQWEKGVWKDLQMVSPVFEAVEGELQLNERGEVEGLARSTYPDGATYEGQYRDGLKQEQGHGTHCLFEWCIFKLACLGSRLGHQAPDPTSTKASLASACSIGTFLKSVRLRSISACIVLLKVCLYTSLLQNRQRPATLDQTMP